ncbi:Uncharacterized protein BCZB5J_02018 [Bacillus cereus]|uniref:DUF5085 domain-containing protein n=1 Tax=Bacillus wiedmannii TaxID=1890302 RepID=A0A2B6SD64_9BACI|nr:DUF5085 family protein [Bacillus wiedmannii]KMP74840.1 hypothetical protein TU62_15155 [Bacillus cereus]MBG9858904.1 hypothetical protein [Bacillus wiedmannii]MCQ6545577.1 DUF5085 family protein [Bacillus wiedmannii]MCQ6570248.1 DUF5085 family protein [Bacillus wiedmannii]MCU5576772.1 DUF5085 family protein [Bacillus wiedmannii]
MIIEGQSIAYTNVVSKEYYIHYTYMKDSIDDFMLEIKKAKLTAKGPLFYALKNVPSDENMYIELFMPIYEDKVPPLETMKFRSYYYVDDMLVKRLTGDYETLTEYAYAEMLQYMEDNELDMISPIYHIFSGDEELQYVEIKIAVDTQ